MDYTLRSPATQPLRGTRPLTAHAARRTAPLEATPKVVPFQATQAAAFQRPASGTGSLGINNDLKTLQAQGRLTPDVLAQLKVLANQPLAEGIDRKALIASALRELVDPERIAQGDSHTCAAAVVQAKLAQDNPSEYLRLLSGLASPAGEVTLANGETMRRHADWQENAGRSLTGDLMQTAFMQFATGSYDTRTDTRATADGRAKGLYAQEQTELLNAISGKQNATVFGNGPKVLAAMEKTLAKGQTVPVVLTIRDRDTGQLQGHSVLVERIQDGRVTFLDPGGQRRTVSLEAFTERLQSASLPKAVVSASLLKASENQTGMLAGWPNWGGLVSAAVKAVTKVAQVISDHAVAPVTKVIKAVAKVVEEHVVRPVMEHVVQPLWEKTVAVAKWAEANKEMLMGITAIACAVIPGLQIVSLILAVASAIDSAKEMYEGIKTGDWKRALQGTAGLLGAAASAFGGPILSKVIGKGATGLARLASGLSRMANGLSDLTDVFNDKLDATTRLGRGLSFLAKGLGGSSAAMGGNFEKAAATFTKVAEKASNYYDRSVSVYGALTSGPLNADTGVKALTESLSLAGDLHSTYANRDNLTVAPGQEKGRTGTYQLKSAAAYLEQGYTAGKGLASGDLKKLPGALKTSAGLASRVNQDVRNDWNQDVDPAKAQGKEASDRLNRGAEYFDKAHTLLNAEGTEPLKAAWALGEKATLDTGYDWSGVPGVPWLTEQRKAAEAWGEDQGKHAEQWTKDRLQEAQRWLDEQKKERTP